MSLLSRDKAALVVIDVQEGFRPYTAFERVNYTAHVDEGSSVPAALGLTEMQCCGRRKQFSTRL